MFTNNIENTTIAYLPNLNSKVKIIYLLICAFVIIAIASLPFLYTDVSVKSQGIIRPNLERTEIKPITSGIIDSIYVTEGQLVQKDCLLVRLKDNSTVPKKILNEYEVQQRQQYIHDLQLLSSTNNISNITLPNLQSPVYKQQISQFIYRKADQEASLKKVKHEIKIDSMLTAEKIIGGKEMFDKTIEGDKLQASFQAFKTQQYGVWEQDLAKYKLELSQLKAQSKQIQADRNLLDIRTPIAGVVQGINTKYNGSFIQNSESLCVISPETLLVAECYLTPQDVGLLKLNQNVKFQIDAFDYNSFGILTGKIIDIDNDFTMVDNKPIFKVHCSFDSKQLLLKNGYTGNLKKGLTLQSRFIIANRSLWQLLFDKIDDWLNPTSPTKTQ